MRCTEMYLAILDDKGQELAIPRIVLYDVPFRLSPGQGVGEQCSFINAIPIGTGPLEAKEGWAAALGLCEEVDSPPFALIPLSQGQALLMGQSLKIAAGMLAMSVSNIGPRGKSVPDPAPKTNLDRIRSRA